ncbi:MAG: hypothetical protein WHT06_05465 [Desulfobacterales bacterium]
MGTNERRRTGIGCFAPRERLVRLLRRLAASPLEETAGRAAEEGMPAFPEGVIPPAAVGFFIAQTPGGFRLFIFEGKGGSSPRVCRAAADLLQSGETAGGAMPWTSAGST